MYLLFRLFPQQMCWFQIDFTCIFDSCCFRGKIVLVPFCILSSAMIPDRFTCIFLIRDCFHSKFVLVPDCFSFDLWLRNIHQGWFEVFFFPYSKVFKWQMISRWFSKILCGLIKKWKISVRHFKCIFSPQRRISKWNQVIPFWLYQVLQMDWI